MADQALQIGELSRRTGCNIETIRYYERIGVMPAPSRRGRYRVYGREDVLRLGFARRARELGFTLDEVRALLRLSVCGEGACQEVRELATGHLLAVRGRIAALTRMEQALAKSVQACASQGDARCPVIEALYSEPP